MKTMKTKHKLLSKAAAVFVMICMLFTLTPLNVFAFSADNYKAQIEKVSVGAPITSVDGGQYLPVTVYFSAAENLGDSNAVDFLEGYLKTTLGDGTTTEGIAGLGMTLMGPLKPDALEGAGSNAFSWEWSEGKGTGVLKYNIPLLDDGETQSAEKSLATGQVEVNGLKADDKVAFHIETVMNSSNFPPEVLPEGGSLMSDEFVITIEDSSNYPKTITQSSGEEKCKHDGKLTYYAANAEQHIIFCEECQKEIGVEDHDFSIHKSGSMDSETGRFYPIDSEDYGRRGDVYGEADICSKCGEVTNFKSAAVKPDLSGAKALIEDLKKYTADEAKLIELELNGEKLDKDTYTVTVQEGTGDNLGKLIVDFEPVEGKSTGKKQVIVDAACKHDGELTYYTVSFKQHAIFCEKCQMDIGEEDHDFSIHKFGKMDSDGVNFYPEDSGDYRSRTGVYGEADICSKCGQATNFKSAAVKPDLSGAKALIEDLKKYTADEAKLIELELNGEKLDKDTYTVTVQEGTGDNLGKLIVDFEPVEGKNSGKKQVIVDKKADPTPTSYPTPIPTPAPEPVIIITPQEIPEPQVTPESQGTTESQDATGSADTPASKDDETPKTEESEKIAVEEEISSNLKEVFTENKVTVTEHEAGSAVPATKKDSAYYDESGKKITNSFIQTSNGDLRYVEATGKSVKKAVVATVDAATGEMKMYYAGRNGVIVKDKVVTLPDGGKIFASEDGTLATDEIVTSGKHQYYADENGKLLTNRIIKKEDGTRYYANKFGYIRKNALFTAPDGDKRYATADGTLAKSCWVTVGKKMYWCNKIGRITKSKSAEND